MSQKIARELGQVAILIMQAQLTVINDGLEIAYESTVVQSNLKHAARELAAIMEAIELNGAIASVAMEEQKHRETL